VSTTTDSTLPDVTDTDAWITCKQAAQALGVDWRALLEIAQRAPIRTAILPGLSISRFYRPDVERVARDVHRDQARPTTARPG
jgi:hypothetical protein